MNLEEKRRISLRLIAQLFAGEILDKPLFGPQITVPEISGLVRSDAVKIELDEAKRIIDQAEADLAQFSLVSKEQYFSCVFTLLFQL